MFISNHVLNFVAKRNVIDLLMLLISFVSLCVILLTVNKKHLPIC